MSTDELIRRANENAAEIREQAAAGAPVTEIPVPVPSIVCARCGHVLSAGDQPDNPNLQPGCHACITFTDEQAAARKRMRR